VSEATGTGRAAAVPPHRPDEAGRGRPPGSTGAPVRTGWDILAVALAAAAFAVLCAVVLRTPTFMPEPDDYAYRGSIVAMTQGHFLSLSTPQFEALGAQLGGPGGPQMTGGPFGAGQAPPAIPQWVQLPGGRWISEKDPGYPFLAAPFQALGIIRLAPLCYGALACLGLYAGAQRWLGRFGGAAAAGLYCSSAAAMLWGWRDYMPTFTDASLIAAGTGALLWAVLSATARPWRRTAAGLAGFVALEAAAFTRYTDIVVLGCAVAAAGVAWRVRAARLPGRTLAWWLGSVAVFAAGLALFDDLVYGGPLRSGYRPGEITFSMSAVLPNLRYMPAHLMQAMPVLVPGLAALAWIGCRFRHRRDLAVALALAASWFTVWGLYATYTWTSAPGASTLQVARFYVPALGAMSLLGAWLVTRLPRREALPAAGALACAAAIAVMFGIGIASFHQMVASPMGGARVTRTCRPPAHLAGHRPGPVRCGPSGAKGPARGPVKQAP
jgi:hypothetical protein